MRSRQRQIELLSMRERDATLTARRKAALAAARLTETTTQRQEAQLARLAAAASTARPPLEHVRRDPSRLLQPTVASARAAREEPLNRSLHSASASSLGSREAPAFGSSSLRFGDAGGGRGDGSARPASASANRHSARTPSWRAGVR